MNQAAAAPADAAPLAATVGEAMCWGLVQCAPETSLRTVAALMAEAQVHCIVVIDDLDDRRSLWGVVSDRDLVAASTVRSLDEQQASGTAMKPAVTAFPHE